MYGGARGGGKSEAALMGALRYVKYADYKAIFFRRTFPQVQDLIDRARRYYKQAYPDVGWQEQKRRFIFPSGAIIAFSHMEHENSCYEHTGKEYHYIGFEELTYFLRKQYIHLTTCSRSSNPNIIPRIVATTNPGGPGHVWVKNYFIDPVPPMTTIARKFIDPVTNRVTYLTRVFIPATVYDNPTLLRNDPRYVMKLQNLDPNKRKMQLEGQWNVFEGQAFPDLTDAHFIPHREPQDGTVKFISIDWGYSTPFSISWWELDPYDRLYKYREWYGVKYDEEGQIMDDKGLELDAFIVAQGVKQRTNEEISYGVYDPKMDSKEGHGASIADSFRRVLDFPLIKANNNRPAGKNQFHARLRPRADGHPGATFSELCHHTKRTLTGLPLDEKNPEDVNTKAEDHIYDGDRYAFMTQPTTEFIVSGYEGEKSLTDIESFRGMKAKDTEEYGIAGTY